MVTDALDVDGAGDVEVLKVDSEVLEVPLATLNDDVVEEGG